MTLPASGIDPGHVVWDLEISAWTFPWTLRSSSCNCYRSDRSTMNYMCMLCMLV